MSGAGMLSGLNDLRARRRWGVGLGTVGVAAISPPT